jgi:DNA-binding GntR family transcriptional regulator
LSAEHPQREARDARRRPPTTTDVSALLTPASPTLLSDTVAERLRDTIFKGYFAPGERLREESLAEALDVSRGPIRDALLQLEREGLVVRRRNRGAMVAQLSRTDLEEVYSLRIAIEPFVCAWAARNATAADWAAMQATIDTYSELDQTVTVDEAADADLRFHDVVYRAAGHKRVLRLWQDLRPQVYIFMLARTYVGEPEFPGIMIRSHGKLLSAIRDGDEERATRVAVDHVQTSYRRVIAGYRADAGTPIRR